MHAYARAARSVAEGSNGSVREDGRGYGDNLPGEAAALRWLAEAEAHGGIQGGARAERRARASSSRSACATGAPSAAAARRIGRRARAHARGGRGMVRLPARRLGGRPLVRAGRSTPYVAREDAVLALGRVLCRAPRHELRPRRSWTDGEFRLLPTRQLLERVAARLAGGDFDAPQPALVRRRGRRPAPGCTGTSGRATSSGTRIRSAPTGGVLIDPMAYGGHAETDLAMLALFGHPLLDEVLLGYDEASPLADGWRERVGLHQLAPLLLHCVLFGGMVHRRGAWRWRAATRDSA